MKSAKRWILIAAVAAIPFATASCKIPLGNGCTYEVLEAHTHPVSGAPFEYTVSTNTGVVC